MTQAIAFAVVFLLGLATVPACGHATSPVSPTGTAPVPTDLQGSGQTVGLSGYVRGLDTRARTFTLMLVSSTAATVTRGDTMAVKADEQTEVRIRGQQVRFAALGNGLLVDVRGADQGRYVLARVISSR